MDDSQENYQNYGQEDAGMGIRDLEEKQRVREF